MTIVLTTFAQDPSVYTMSIHQANNYPAVKPPSSIDINLPDHTTDEQYLSWLDNALSSGLRQFRPDLLCYVAGADPYKDDQLGGLDLTIEGLKQRDEMVFRAARAKEIPVMVTFAGGYANNVEDTITIHCNTIAAAKESKDFNQQDYVEGVGSGAQLPAAFTLAQGQTTRTELERKTKELGWSACPMRRSRSSTRSGRSSSRSRKAGNAMGSTTSR